jgi:aldehyde dehydrogenase (NAD+)
MNLNSIFQLQKTHAQTLRATTARERIQKLRTLEKALLSNRQAFRDAMAADFSKPAFETDITELAVSLTEIRHSIAHLQSWMTPRSMPTPIALIGTRSEVRYEPKGCSLIISPWNFPVNLTIVPLVSAISAGCTAMIKPSEFTPNTARLLKIMLENAFPIEEIAVFEGDATISTKLLALKFDHIFFTGSPSVGKIVMRAAAENLISVTLELGGKSPVFIDETADLADAASKIAWLKTMNAGQICIEPDYVLIPENRLATFVEHFQKKVETMFGSTAEARKASPDFPRICHDRAFVRVKNLVDDAVLKGAKIAFGGQMDAAERYIEPTILVDVPKNALIWDEEIFGPVLPVLPYQTFEEAIYRMNLQEKPLSQYIFSKKTSVVERVLRETSAGGVTVNDCALHFYNTNLPFGGVNNSGIGKCHGEAGFLAFSNEKAVLFQNPFFAPFKLLHPPYGKLGRFVADFMVKWL